MTSNIPLMMLTHVTPSSSPWLEGWELTPKQDNSIEPRGQAEDPRKSAGISMLGKTTSGAPSCISVSGAGETTRGSTVSNLMKKWHKKIENWRSIVWNP